MSARLRLGDYEMPTLRLTGETPDGRSTGTIEVAGEPMRVWLPAAPAAVTVTSTDLIAALPKPKARVGKVDDEPPF